MSSSSASTGRKPVPKKQKDEEDILEDEERSIDSEPMTEEDRAFIADDSVDDEDAELELAQVLLAFRKGKYKD
jgi:hypothetical protein